MKKPQAPKSKIVDLAVEHWERCGPSGLALPSHYMFAARGYWPKSMGPTPGNDPGIFDDAWFFIGPKTFLAIAANTDPSRYGWNAGAGKPMAVLNTGFWPFFRGPHKGKTPALRQYTQSEARKAGVPNDGRFSVTRTYAKGDSRNCQEAGYYAINCHSGGIENTSSEGCQTASSRVYLKFMRQVWDETIAAKVNTIWYGLIDGPIT